MDPDILREKSRLCRLDEICDLNPRHPKNCLVNSDFVTFVPMASVGAADGSINVSTKRLYAEVKKGFTPFQSNDVLFAKITPCMENGKMAVVPHLENPYCFGSTEFHVIRPKGGSDPKYIYYFVSGQDFRKEAAHHMTGAVGQKRVPTEFLKQCLIPLPPTLEDQKRIVAEIEKQFSRLDEAVASLKRIQANLKRYKAAVLKAAAEGKLTEQWRKDHPDVEPADQLLKRILAERRAKWEAEELAKMKAKGIKPKDDSWKKKYKEPAGPDTADLPELPVGWVWVLIDQLSIVIRGASPRPAGDPRYFGGNIPWITVGEITKDETKHLNSVSNFVTEDGKKASRFIEPGTFLLTNSGATLGVPKITNIGGCINDGSVALLQVVEPTKGYLYFLLKGMTERLRKINQGAAQPNLNTDIVRNINVPLPPIFEQQNILEEIDRRLSVTEELEVTIENNLKRAERLRQTILQRAFSVVLM